MAQSSPPTLKVAPLPTPFFYCLYSSLLSLLSLISVAPSLLALSLLLSLSLSTLSPFLGFYFYCLSYLSPDCSLLLSCLFPPFSLLPLAGSLLLPSSPLLSSLPTSHFLFSLPPSDARHTQAGGHREGQSQGTQGPRSPLRPGLRGSYLGMDSSG